jgi:hypothetical protein
LGILLFGLRNITRPARNFMTFAIPGLTQ